MALRRNPLLHTKLPVSSSQRLVLPVLRWRKATRRTQKWSRYSYIRLLSGSTSPVIIRWGIRKTSDEQQYPPQQYTPPQAGYAESGAYTNGSPVPHTGPMAGQRRLYTQQYNHQQTGPMIGHAAAPIQNFTGRAMHHHPYYGNPTVIHHNTSLAKIPRIYEYAR